MMNKLLNKIPDPEPHNSFVGIENPELVFGIVGPIGVDIDSVIEELKKSLREVNYDSELIHLTEHMEDPRIELTIDHSTYFDKYISLIKYANEFRKTAAHKAAMAGLAVLQIRNLRESRSGDAKCPRLGTAYIVRQFKRAEEIDLMRRVYGRKFIQVSVYGNESDRRDHLMEKIRRYNASPKSDIDCETQALNLIDKDFNEKDDENGQRLSDVFHLGDVFVDSLNKTALPKTVHRFVYALFGHNGCSPNKDEYGLYTAASAALRSIDLSRQVGAAIFTDSGEVISLGCNDVPRPSGGMYWCDDPDDKFRDFERKADPNQERRNEVIFDLIKRLNEREFLSKDISDLQSDSDRVDVIMADRSIMDSQIMDMLEFGRVVHAEMAAITDAARLGRSVSKAILFCTTFPCHMCAKHIVSSGISRVVFLEPYPKSYAKKLHSDAISFDPKVQGRVLFTPFIGISPRRYRDIFEKKKRKDDGGKAIDWYHNGRAVPMIEDRSPAYIDNEIPWIVESLSKLGPTRESFDAASGSSIAETPGA